MLSPRLKSGTAYSYSECTPSVHTLQSVPEKGIPQADVARFLGLLRNVRAEHGLRQEDLARLLGRSQSYVSKYETGENKLSFLEVRRICQVLGVSFEGFVRRFER